MMSNIFQQAGDDPNLPYVVLTSFTGAASANINGQTLHSLFGFKFGTTFLSLSERQRAEKRALFKNLRCIIIDEISMVSADLFYNLDLRLREIKPEKGDRPFSPSHTCEVAPEVLKLINKTVFLFRCHPSLLKTQNMALQENRVTSDIVDVTIQRPHV